MDPIADRDALDAALDYSRAGFKIASIAIPSDEAGDLEVTLTNGRDKLSARVPQRASYQAATDELNRLVDWHAAERRRHPQQGRLRINATP